MRRQHRGRRSKHFFLEIMNTALMQDKKYNRTVESLDVEHLEMEVGRQAYPYIVPCHPSLSLSTIPVSPLRIRSLSVLKSHFSRPLVTSSRRHFLRSFGSSLLADICFHFTLCFLLLVALEAMLFGLKACVSWEPNSCRTYLTMQLSLIYPVHTRCAPWPGLGHAPRPLSQA